MVTVVPEEIKGFRSDNVGRLKRSFVVFASRGTFSFTVVQNEGIEL
jgi:hypothetical protein